VLSWAIGGRGTFFCHFEQSPACINIIDGGPPRFIVRTVNSTAYDPAHVGPRQSTLEETLAQYRAYRRAAP
jgi:hypothetical protein